MSVAKHGLPTTTMDTPTTLQKRPASSPLTVEARQPTASVGSIFPPRALRSAPTINFNDFQILLTVNFGEVEVASGSGFSWISMAQPTPPGRKWTSQIGARLAKQSRKCWLFSGHARKTQVKFVFVAKLHTACQKAARYITAASMFVTIYSCSGFGNIRLQLDEWMDEWMKCLLSCHKATGHFWPMRQNTKLLKNQ